jgi:phosphomannomutase
VALALGALAEYDGPISQKRKEMPQYEILKSKIDLRSTEQVRVIVQQLREAFRSRAVRMNDSDGLRIDFERSWIHARGSNTEPIIRLIAEAPTAEEASELLGQAEQAIG